MNRFDWLKAIGFAVLTEVSLVAVSFNEVLLWACLQNAPPDAGACERHAHQSAPWVSAIAGALLMYVFSSLLLRGLPAPTWRLALLLPTLYLLLDVAILSFYPIDWAGNWPILAGATVPKYLGAIAAFRNLLRRRSIRYKMGRERQPQQALR